MEKNKKEENVLEPELMLNGHSEEVRSMFSTITKRYDLLNHVCSLGIDYWWRRVLVNGFVFGESKKVLDMAAGTLDVSLAALRRYKDISVVSGDICAEMLEYGKKKIRSAEKDRIRTEIINALSVPYENESFDIVSMAFGIRNVDERGRALAEMARVLRVGGQLHILEFSPVKNPFLQKCYYFYLEKVMPLIAKIFGENAEAYEYLGRTIKNFPDSDSFCAEIKQAGFEFVACRKLTFGIVSIYTAIKTK